MINLTECAEDKDERLRLFERIKRRSEINSFFDDRKNTRYFCGKDRIYSVLVKKNSFSYSRFAVSVKKSKGNSPKRNKAKRYVREIFRRNKSIIPKGYDYFVLINSAETMSFENRTECFLSMFDKVLL